MLPRFKLEQGYDLIKNLQELGVTDLFKDSGDFSEMTSEKVSMNWVSLKPSSYFLFCFLIAPYHLYWWPVSDSPAPCSAYIAETPGNHHGEWGGDRGCSFDTGGLHASLLSDPLHCGPSLPLPDLWTPYRLPRLHWPSGQSFTELNLDQQSFRKEFRPSI